MCLAKTEIEKAMVKSFIVSYWPFFFFFFFFPEEAMHGKAESKE